MIDSSFFAPVGIGLGVGSFFFLYFIGKGIGSYLWFKGKALGDKK